MSTYLQLCQKMIRDLGMSNTISTVTGATGMNQKITDWIADADEFIQTLWFDWNFLWAQHNDNTVAGTRLYSKPSDLGVWDLDSFWLDYTTDSNVHLTYLSYREYRDGYRQGTQTNGTPGNFILTPTNNIYLHPIPDGVYSMTADYWKTPTRMTVDASTSLIPTRYERIIIARAKIHYAEHEEFPAVLESATAEFNKLLKQLEASELPEMHRARGRASAHDMNMVERVI